MHRCSVAKLAIGVVAITAPVACDNAPTAVAPPSATTASLTATAVDAVVIGDHPPDFSDVFNRLLPGFGDQGVATQLREQLDESRTAYEAGDRRAVRQSLTQAEALLVRSGAHPADMSAVRLALARVLAALDEQ